MDYLLKKKGQSKECLYGENTGKVNCEKKWKNVPVRHFVYLRRQNLIKRIHKAGLHVCENYRHIYVQQHKKMCLMTIPEKIQLKGYLV